MSTSANPKRAIPVATRPSLASKGTLTPDAFTEGPMTDPARISGYLRRLTQPWAAAAKGPKQQEASSSVQLPDLLTLCGVLRCSIRHVVEALHTLTEQGYCYQMLGIDEPICLTLPGKTMPKAQVRPSYSTRTMVSYRYGRPTRRANPPRFQKVSNGL